MQALKEGKLLGHQHQTLVVADADVFLQVHHLLHSRVVRTPQGPLGCPVADDVSFYGEAARSPSDHLFVRQSPAKDMGISDGAVHGHVLVHLVPVHAAKGEYCGILAHLLHRLNHLISSLVPPKCPILDETHPASFPIEGDTGVPPNLEREPGKGVPAKKPSNALRPGDLETDPGAPVVDTKEDSFLKLCPFHPTKGDDRSPGESSASVMYVDQRSGAEAECDLGGEGELALGHGALNVRTFVGNGRLQVEVLVDKICLNVLAAGGGNEDAGKGKQSCQEPDLHHGLTMTANALEAAWAGQNNS